MSLHCQCNCENIGSRQTGRNILVPSYKDLDSINNSTICQLFGRSIVLLWPESVKHDDILLLIIGAALYTVQAVKAIKVFYSKMVHVICLVHDFIEWQKKSWKIYSKIDKLVLHKKVFVEAPSCRELLKYQVPNILLPPEPIMTQWGMWINTCV